ncbi:MAG: hypothetical protein KC619_16060 [Myxococcales bacterium]|nr:hypothetical protein [Myxococcales bacterium]
MTTVHIGMVVLLACSHATEETSSAKVSVVVSCTDDVRGVLTSMIQKGKPVRFVLEAVLSGISDDYIMYACDDLLRLRVVESGSLRERVAAAVRDRRDARVLVEWRGSHIDGRVLMVDILALRESHVL